MADLEYNDIGVVFLDRRPPRIRADVLDEIFKSKERTWMVRFPTERLRIEDRRSFEISCSKARRELDLESAHQELLRGLSRASMYLERKRVIGITRRCLPGNWMSISDYERRAIISVHKWNESFAPPSMEVFVAKEILVYCLVFASSTKGGELFHEETRGCFFDSYYDRLHVRAGLWGHICPACRKALKRGGVTAEKQREAVYILQLVASEERLPVAPVCDHPSCFLSYSHKDRPFAKRLSSKLQAHGARCYLYGESMKAGRVEKQLDRAIKRNPIFLLVLSANSVESDWVEWEAASARDLEKKLGRDVLCPVALDEAWKTCSWPGPLRRQIEDYQILDFSGWQDTATFERQFGKLLDGLSLFYKPKRS